MTFTRVLQNEKEPWTSHKGSGRNGFSAGNLGLVGEKFILETIFFSHNYSRSLTKDPGYTADSPQFHFVTSQKLQKKEKTNRLENSR